MIDADRWPVPEWVYAERDSLDDYIDAQPDVFSLSVTGGGPSDAGRALGSGT